MIFSASRKVEKDSIEITGEASVSNIYRYIEREKIYCSQCIHDIGKFNVVCKNCHDFGNFEKKEEIRTDIINKCKEDYWNTGWCIMSEYLRQCPYELTAAEKRYLLEYAGEEDYVMVDDKGQIIDMED